MQQEVVDESQSAFIKVRHIDDGVLVANVCMDEYRGRKEAVVLTLDLEKAYDRIRWEFLDYVFAPKGFSTPWRQWIDSVLLYYSPTGFLPCIQGVKAGNPFPIFFILIGDAFSLLILRASLEV